MYGMRNFVPIAWNWFPVPDITVLYYTYCIQYREASHASLLLGLVLLLDEGIFD
jgi:hypothetical protein